MREVIDIESVAKKAGRRGDGGIYLVVADETPEFQMALRYAVLMARVHRGYVGILQVTNIDDFQHWGSVEERMRKELREQAEKFIWNSAKSANELNGTMPVLYIEEGNRTDVLIDVINRDQDIRQLILGGGTTASGPGTLVSYFTGKGLGKLRVPVVVVPGHLDAAAIDALG